MVMGICSLARWFFVPIQIVGSVPARNLSGG